MILFSPAAVDRVLVGAPSVAALLPSPSVEGVPSEAFPALRKTDRAAYRWIAGTRYPHLAEAVALMERVYAAGCRFDGLLTTRSRRQFIGHSGELLVADDLLRRGYSLTTLSRSAGASPDLHVVGGGIDVVVEVYTPRELLAVDDWLEEVKDLLMQIDLPADYDCSVETRIVDTVPYPERPNSWEVADMIETTHEDVLATVEADVDRNLRGLQPFAGEYVHEGTPLVTRVELRAVQASAAVGPRRRGTISAPGFGGYSPAGVFGTIVKRAKKKAAKRQTLGVEAPARVLVVTLDQVKIAGDLTHPAHSESAGEKLDSLEPGDYGLDAIAFVVRVKPKGLAALSMVTDDDGALTEEQAKALFWARPDAVRYWTARGVNPLDA